MKYLHTYIELTLRKLKDLKGKSDWEIKMISRNRKTLAVEGGEPCMGRPVSTVRRRVLGNLPW